MAIGTITVVKTGVFGDLKYATGTFVGEATYTVGGTATTGSALSNGWITGPVYFGNVTLGTNGNRVIAPLLTTGSNVVTTKLFTALGTELTAVSDAANTYRYIIWGK